MKQGAVEHCGGVRSSENSESRQRAAHYWRQTRSSVQHRQPLRNGILLLRDRSIRKRYINSSSRSEQSRVPYSASACISVTEILATAAEDGLPVAMSAAHPRLHHLLRGGEIAPNVLLSNPSVTCAPEASFNGAAITARV